MNVNQNKIYNYLLDEIISGKLTLQDRIPTENELGKKFGTTRMNAHRAVKKLEKFGILQRNKKNGTSIYKIPSSITTGELKSVNTRRVCVLNHNNPLYSQIHWNERIISSFEENIKQNKIEMIFKDISHLNSLDEFCIFIKNITEEGYNSLVIVSDYFIDSIVSEHPEVFFQFHNNVFIFDRGTNDWHSWPYNVVSVNLFKEGVIVAEYLLQKGFKKIIYYKFGEKFYWEEERERGLQFGLMRSSEGKIHADIIELSSIKEDIILGQIKSSSEECAVVAANDEIAARLSDAATQKKIKPGVDFGLMGFDDNIKYRKYNLTTVSQPLEKIGTKLSELVINNLDNRETGEISTIRIDSELIIRKTC